MGPVVEYWLIVAVKKKKNQHVYMSKMIKLQSVSEEAICIHIMNDITAVSFT